MTDDEKDAALDNPIVDNLYEEDPFGTTQADIQAEIDDAVERKSAQFRKEEQRRQSQRTALLEREKSKLEGELANIKTGRRKKNLGWIILGVLLAVMVMTSAIPDLTAGYGSEPTKEVVIVPDTEVVTEYVYKNKPVTKECRDFVDAAMEVSHKIDYISAGNSEMIKFVDMMKNLSPRPTSQEMTDLTNQMKKVDSKFANALNIIASDLGELSEYDGEQNPCTK